ncbi:hypothetical protein PR003_g530 [Phytophthora rubi]|uniref:BED-type domain-containing protein n=1 Tax=Phytophthora rubi TaxID=129364 RepID=A0A6A3P2F9_9STRA|nr:hypothetical protein PR002_g796 [Phytophthora rubi]KAE9052568.1 hypothetical protein PR001_g382 [Phytophthora rubi]KAE9359804.1 hypothetical protein PR003_g530 [Phytophthora rubi]
MDATPATLKRTGRPVHPLWAHFHRGEKRNRYHYHAYCSYCVARHGADQVPPTRGVSSDMLRHLESCPNCPRKVVDTVKELCGRRERSAHTKKHAIGNSGNDCSRLEDDDQVLLLDAVAVAATAAAMHDTQHTTADDAAAVLAASAGTATETEDTPVTGKRTASEALEDMPRLTHVDTRGGAEMDKRGTSKRGGGYLAMSTKRGRTDSDNAAEQVARWRTSVLQAAVAAGIPLSAFQKSEFQELLQVLSPARVDSDEVINSVGGQTFLEETAAKLAPSQLDRVKEGMLNSTIKSGLTLSITSWCTLDLQHLVAFTLVNSNGDAACVRVEDLGGHIPQHVATGDDNDSSSPMALLRPDQLLPLADAIEDVLQELNDKNICVMGIVADSAEALSAAKRVCRSERWRSLLVVPCMSALLTSLVGSVLTHEAYCDAVGQLVELAAYFSNARLQASLRVISGEDDARIPLPTREHWFSFVVCLTKALHYSDAITALCSSQDERCAPLAPLALRELVLGGNAQLWKTLRELAVLLAPLREAYSLVFQAKPKLGEINSTYDNDDECATTVHAGLTLAHVMYQLGRMSQQYAALAESADMSSSSTSNGENTTVVAQRLHEILDVMWQRYDLPTMVLAYVFDFHMDTGRLDMSNTALQWKAVASYFQLYFQRWFCQPHDSQGQTANGSTLLGPIPSNKIEGILNSYQLRQFPFDAETTSDYTDVSSFYSFVSESHPEICALCCRVYAVALACADLRRVIRGIGFLPSVAQTTERPEQVELLLHVGFATSLKRTRRCETPASDGSNILPELLQASRPEELLCSQDEWEAFASDWKESLDHEVAVDEFEQLQQLEGGDSIDSHPDKSPSPGVVRLSLNQLFFEALPPLPAAVVVAPSPHDPSGAVTQASVAL